MLCVIKCIRVAARVQGIGTKEDERNEREGSRGEKSGGEERNGKEEWERGECGRKRNGGEE